MRGKKLFFPLGLIASGLFAFGLVAEETKDPAKDKDKPAFKPKQSASQALALAAKNLARVKNYRVAADIEGGISDRADHKVVERIVNESYSGEVFQPGNLMHVPSMSSSRLSGVKAFRYPNQKKGTAFIQGQWRLIGSHSDTLRMDKLFAFPEILMSRALVGANTAQWIITDEDKAEMEGGKSKAGSDDAAQADSDTPDADKADSEGSEPKDDVEKPKASDKKSGDKAGDKKPGKKTDAKKADSKPEAKKAQPGKTISRKALQAAEEEKAFQPHLLRVDVPPQEALKHFTEVQNSGCMSAG